MSRFYLNECLGGAFDCHILTDAFIVLIKAFAKLSQKKYLKVNKGWILEKEAGKIVLGGVRLADILKNIKDREAKRLFYSYTLNYPIEDFFTKADHDRLLAADYTFCSQDATNMVIVGENGGILLSLPVSENIKKDILLAHSDKADFKEVIIYNFHGATQQNIESTEKLLLRKNYDSCPEGIGKLEYLAPKVIMSDMFKESFVKVPSEHITSIFKRMDEVLANNLLQPLRCNGTMIKHVDEHVAELRIVNPVDIRIYFHEDRDTLYFAKMALKSEYVGKNAQNDDITASEKIIRELMQENV